jgi:DNA-binding CsgD family transcriptional regulator
MALSPREQQLVGHLADGKTNKEIATAMDIAYGTVKIYMSRLFRKTGIHSRLAIGIQHLKSTVSQLSYENACLKQDLERARALAAARDVSLMECQAIIGGMPCPPPTN